MSMLSIRDKTVPPAMYSDRPRNSHNVTDELALVGFQVNDTVFDLCCWFYAIGLPTNANNVDLC